MAFQLPDLLFAILVELRVANQLAAEEAGRDDELDDLRYDEVAAFGDPTAPLASPET